MRRGAAAPPPPRPPILQAAATGRGNNINNPSFPQRWRCQAIISPERSRRGGESRPRPRGSCPRQPNSRVVTTGWMSLGKRKSLLESFWTDRRRNFFSTSFHTFDFFLFRHRSTLHTVDPHTRLSLFSIRMMMRNSDEMYTHKVHIN